MDAKGAYRLAAALIDTDVINGGFWRGGGGENGGNCVSTYHLLLVGQQTDSLLKQMQTWE